ncbi:hypothetical protein LTR56_006255 [Elasticomyces elasticus]|nr:hypothetical protein LTR56_006255 [Elasticomyces elasticus]KAK3666536.1 hypothetical protein LTR22_002480 [Elasticomyces elasticus]KAK4928331.1 hypothetical protein LTR49_005008 [Elasticomyces elasticus]KAK5763894.1 hypothetical protein LTS12_006012 [Elasticomyces elasticus]
MLLYASQIVHGISPKLALSARSLQALNLALKGALYRLDLAMGHTTPCWQDRAWVLQEYVLSSDAHICWDRYRLRYSIELDTLLRTVRPSPRIMRLQEFLRQNGSIILGLRQWNSGILETASRTTVRDSQASNPHDKVFSLLGIVNKEEARQIVVDYTAPLWVTYARATYACTTRGPTERGKLQILEYITWPPDRPPSLPSWVLDFSRMPTRAWSGSLSKTFWWPGGREHSQPWDRGISLDLRCLTTYGVKFGTVTTSLTLYERLWSQADDVVFVTQDSSPTCQVVLIADLTAQALRGRVRSSLQELVLESNEPEPDYLADLAHKLEEQTGDHVDSTAVLRSLDICFSYWENKLAVQHCSAIGLWNPHSYRMNLCEWLDFTSRSSSICLLASSNGYVGLAPNGLEAGDVIVFLYEAATLNLNPFLTITRKVAEEGSGSNFQYYDDVGLHLAADGTHGLTFTYDGTYQSRLDLTYKYDIDQAEPKSSQAIDNMLLTHPPCVSLRLLHRSADPQEDMKTFWDRHGLRKAEFDVCASTVIKVGTLLEGMKAGAPSVEDQEEYRRSLREKSKRSVDGGEFWGVGGGLAGPANAIMNMASMIEVAEDTPISTTGPETHNRPKNDAQDSETTATMDEPESTNKMLDHGSEEPIRHSTPNENTEHANDATETQAGEVAKAEETEDVEAARPYTAEYALVGGTEWCILQGTVETITGWKMLDIFDMSQGELSKQECIQ